MTDKNLALAACLLAACLPLAGCLNPAMFKKGAFAMDDWDSWTSWNDAYGTGEVRADGLHYCLTARQDDTRNSPSEGYYPGLIMSRDLMGSRWRADLEADFKIPQGNMKRFSFGVWVGIDPSRPSLGNADALMKLLVQRQNGPRPEDDSYTLVMLPGGRPSPLPPKTKVLRFEREENFFTVSASRNRKDFVPLLRVDATTAADAPSQRFFVGGFAGGDPAGACARFKSLKINGAEVLR